MAGPFDTSVENAWCPGCGNFPILTAVKKALERTGKEKHEIVLVSGIGCSGRLPVYVDFNTLHTTHGRALTFATGVKLAKPSLKVIVIMGDGACGGHWRKSFHPCLSQKCGYECTHV